jgi:hypothetical protein
MENSAVTVYSPSQDRSLSTALLSIKDQLHQAAIANVEAQIAGQDYTQIEKHAMTVVQELKLVNGMDLAAVLLRYDLVRQIETEALWTSHPAHYTSRDEMARDQGISPSELSNIMDLGGVIFPYIQDTLGIPVAQMWEEIGKSNFRELVPVLKYIISGERPERENTASRAAEAFLNDVAATAAAAGQNLNDAQIRGEAVERLLEAGRLTNRELRAQLRPERTQSINATKVRYNNRTFILAEVTEDQETLVQRRLGEYIDFVTANLPIDRRQRQLEATRTPVLGSIIRLVEE